MVNYKRMIQQNRNRRLTEDDDIEDIAISDRLYDIANDLGIGNARDHARADHV